MSLATELLGIYSSNRFLKINICLTNLTKWLEIYLNTISKKLNWFLMLSHSEQTLNDL